MLQQPALADRRALRVELAGARPRATRCARIIVEAFAALTAEQVIARLDEAQIANARINDMHDVWAHPQLQARERWTEVDTPAGPVPALLPPGCQRRMRRAWTRCRRSASTPTPSCASWAIARDDDRRAARGAAPSEATRAMNDRPTGTLAALRRRRCASKTFPRRSSRRAEDLLLDWLGSALAGKGARPVEAIARFARRDGPARRAVARC